MKNTTKSTLSLAAAVAAAFTLAPAAQAAIVFFTDSDQLNLAGRDVLAAVNLWDVDRGVGGASPGPGHVAVTSIQGKTFTNFGDLDTGSAHNVTQGTLTMLAPKNQGRENNIAMTGPNASDILQATHLGGAGWNAASDLDMTFDFGSEWANKTVEIQLIGGGTSAHTNEPRFDISVGGDLKGTLISGDGSGGGVGVSGNPYLMTFTETLDASGDISVKVDYLTTGAARDLHLRGVIVTVVPEPATMSLLALGGLGLLRRRRRA